MGRFTPSAGLCARSGWRTWVVTAFALGSILSAPAAPAQEAPSGKLTLQLQLCGVAGRAVAEAGEQQVFAHCWGTGLDLGRANTFRTFLNPDRSATLVELVHNGELRVLLLRPGAEGRPLIEDISGVLALAGGRAPWDKLSGLGLHYDDFPGHGRVGVHRGLARAPSGREQQLANSPIEDETDEAIVEVAPPAAIAVQGDEE